jgi:hypothetical protein
MKATLSNSATINVLVNQAMMLVSGRAAQTEAGIGFIEQWVLGGLANCRTPCNQALTPPTLPPRAVRAKAWPPS